MKTNTKEKILWGAFFITIFTSYFFVVGFSQISVQNFLIVSLPLVILVFLFIIWSLGLLKGVLFMLLCFLIGFVSEYMGVKFGFVFGGNYEYSNLGLALANIPLIVILYWLMFICAGYNITNAFLFWIKKEKPSKGKKDIVLLPFLIILDGLIVTAIDVFMEPLQVEAGSWAWAGGGQYFDIPIGNFIGWFIVVAIVTSIFRIFEYFYPKEIVGISKQTFIIPVIGYGQLCFCFIILALKSNMIDLAMIGFFAMFSVIFVNLMLFAYWKFAKLA